MALKMILSLYDYSGVWSRPYVEAGGYAVVRVDVGHPAGWWDMSRREMVVGGDLGDDGLAKDLKGFGEWWGVLAAPPCTCFCRPAALRWAGQDASGKTAREMKLFRRAFEFGELAKGWWAVENPPGRHLKLMPELPEKAWQFQPWEFGHPWVKQSYIWGSARRPERGNVVEPEATVRQPNGRLRGRIAGMSSSWKRQRAETPEGFARAFFAANP